MHDTDANQWFIKTGRKLFHIGTSQYIKRYRKYRIPRYKIKIKKGRKSSEWVVEIHQCIKGGRKTKQKKNDLPFIQQYIKRDRKYQEYITKGSKLSSKVFGIHNFFNGKSKQNLFTIDLSNLRMLSFV